MKKILVFLLLIVLAVFMASAYGVLHNQISYSVSPEYFTKFKFQQFGMLESALPERFRASLVGFHASWWMGVPIGVLVGAGGFMHAGARRMLRVTLWALLLSVGVTLAVGLVGLGYGYLQTATFDIADYKHWYLPDDVLDMRRFLCAGYMHNASYLGGLLSIFAAWGLHLVVRLRAKP